MADADRRRNVVRSLHILGESSAIPKLFGNGNLGVTVPRRICRFCAYCQLTGSYPASSGGISPLKSASRQLSNGQR